jgi:hypothetical protein
MIRITHLNSSYPKLIKNMSISIRTLPKIIANCIKLNPFHRIFNTSLYKTNEVIHKSEDHLENIPHKYFYENNQEQKEIVPYVQKCELIYYEEKPLILFDLNGTLLNRYNTQQQKQIVFRPGINNLKKLKNKFEVGIYSCMRDYNVKECVQRLEQSLGENFFTIILDQNHCVKAPKDVCEYLNKPYAMMKPIDKHSHFTRKSISKILLIDDSKYKVLREEKKNLILIPTWTNEQKDNTLEVLVRSLLRHVPHQGDVRKASHFINSKIKMLSK